MMSVLVMESLAVCIVANEKVLMLVVASNSIDGEESNVAEEFSIDGNESNGAEEFSGAAKGGIPTLSRLRPLNFWSKERRSQ